MLSDAALRNYPSKMARSFEGYELPNELDASGSPEWTATLLGSLAQFQVLDVDPRVTHFPVVGPSLTTPESYAALGDVSGLRQRQLAQLHGRPQSWDPGWGRRLRQLDGTWRLRRLRSGRPIVTRRRLWTIGPPVSIPGLNAAAACRA